MRRRAPSPPTSLPRHQALVVNRDTATTAVATIATTAFALLESPLRPEPALARCGGLWARPVNAPRPATIGKMHEQELRALEVDSQTRQVFLLLSNKLNDNLTKLCAKALKERNGLEAYRIIAREIYDGMELRLDLEIQDIAFRVSKSLAELKKKLIELDMMSDEFQAKL